MMKTLATYAFEQMAIPFDGQPRPESALSRPSAPGRGHQVPDNYLLAASRKAVITSEDARQQSLGPRFVLPASAQQREALLRFHLDPFIDVDLTTLIRYADWRRTLPEKNWPVASIDDLGRMFGIPLADRKDLATRVHGLADYRGRTSPFIDYKIVQPHALRAGQKMGMVRAGLEGSSIRYPRGQIEGSHFLITKAKTEFVHRFGGRSRKYSLRTVGRNELGKIVALLMLEDHVSHVTVQFGDNETTYLYTYYGNRLVPFAMAQRIYCEIEGKRDHALYFALLDFEGEPLDFIYTNEASVFRKTSPEANTFWEHEETRVGAYIAALGLLNL